MNISPRSFFFWSGRLILIRQLIWSGSMNCRVRSYIVWCYSGVYKGKLVPSHWAEPEREGNCCIQPRIKDARFWHTLHYTLFSTVLGCDNHLEHRPTPPLYSLPLVFVSASLPSFSLPSFSFSSPSFSSPVRGWVRRAGWSRQ
jgi:hypothetical protein